MSDSGLPRALVRAGLALLDEEGPEGLTLRRIASRAGVSHAAPAHHFGGLPGLKTAIAVNGFQQFLEALSDSRDSLPADASPFQRLLAVNMAYIDFANRHNALFRLMFDQLPAQDPELRRIALGSYVVLRDMCAPFAADHDDVVPVETAVWALTHGFAALNLNQAFPPGSPVRVSGYEDALRLLVN